jgi:hypothetical protein
MEWIQSKIVDYDNLEEKEYKIFILEEQPQRTKLNEDQTPKELQFMILNLNAVHYTHRIITIHW